MKHYVIGSGNLGSALLNTFEGSVGLMSRKPISSYIGHIQDSEDTWIWNSEGFGSVGECKADPSGAFDCHVTRVISLMNLFPKSNIVNFSTNYVVDTDIPSSGEPKRKHESYYSYTKAMMEWAIKMHPKKNVYAVRVANLYSKYKPDSSFVGRIKQNADKIKSLPYNELIPTDTDWLAMKLKENLHLFRYVEDKILGIAPLGSVGTKELAEIVLGRKLETSYDNERPIRARIYNTFQINEDWKQVLHSATEYRKALGLVDF